MLTQRKSSYMNQKQDFKQKGTNWFSRKKKQDRVSPYLVFMKGKYIMVYHRITITFEKAFTEKAISSKLVPLIENQCNFRNIWVVFTESQCVPIHDLMVAINSESISIHDFKDIVIAGLKECKFEILDVLLSEDISYYEFNSRLPSNLKSNKVLNNLRNMGADVGTKKNIDAACYDQLPQSLVNEISRIRRTRPDYFIGYPCIYILPILNDGAISILMRELYENNRLRSKHIYRNAVIKNIYDFCSPENELITDNFLMHDQDADTATNDSNTMYSINNIATISRHRQLFIISSKSKDYWISACNKYHINCVYIDTNNDLIDDTELYDYIKSFLEKRNDPEVEITEDLIAELINMVRNGESRGYKFNRLRLFESLTVYFKNTYKLKKQFHEYMVNEKVSDNFGKGNSIKTLNRLIGLNEVKNDIKSLLNVFLYANSMNKATVLENKNMIFTGNPGTCKTTVARLLANILYENGVITNERIKEVGRQDLVGKWVGWTASIVKKAYEDAEGGILFIDEAYSLSQDKGGYGIEAINTIVQCMENYRDTTITIFAGYPEEMAHFLESNPGLRSRIGFYVNFPNYTVDELCQIFKKMVKDRGLKVTSGAIENIKNLFETKMMSKDFGNGRFVRNVLDKVVANHANRMINKYSNIFDAPMTDKITIRKEDVMDLNIKGIVVNTNKAGF